MSSSEPAVTPAQPTTVLVVEDGTAARAQITDIIARAGGFEVIAETRSGYEAIRVTHERNPDLVVLGIGTVDMRGIEVLAYISAESPRPVVLLSPNAQATHDPALATVDFGNIEFVLRPAGSGPANEEVLRRRLLAALEAATRARIGGLRINRARRAAARASRAARRAARTGADAAGEPAEYAVAIAASTGGPRALLELVPALPQDLPAAVLIVQHMPAAFTAFLAQRLDRISRLHVKEAIAGERLKRGVVYLAPGGRHMALQRTATGVSIVLEDSEPIWGLRPAADVLFGSVARHFGPRSMGLVLTGMGKDGAAGLRAIQDVGGATAVQQAETAVVPSMPRAARPFASIELPLNRLARWVAERAAQRERKSS